MEKVSIVIVTHNSKEHLVGCLKSLNSTAYTYEDHEVIVVDNASDYAAVIQDICIQFDYRYIRSDVNLSFDAANDLAISTSDGKYFILLNDDTLPAKDFWIEKWIQFAEDHPRAGAIGCRLVFPQNDTIQHCGVVFNQYRQPFHKLAGTDVNDPRVLAAKQFQAVTFAAVLIRREAYLAAGGFTRHDVWDTYTYEDIDLCFKMRAAGWEIWYAPEVIIYHYSATSYGKILKRKEDAFKNLPALIDQWFIEIDNDDWKELDVPPHNPEIAVGIPLTEGSGWRFEQLMSMVAGFHYWKKNLSLILSVSDSGPAFLEKVQNWAKLNGATFKDVMVSTKVSHHTDKMLSVYANREEIRQAFLAKTKAEYLFFIDSDVSMERTTLRGLIDICEIQGADIAAAPYFYKSEDRPRPMLFKKVIPTRDYKNKTLKSKNEIAYNRSWRNAGLGNFTFANELMDGGVHPAEATGMGCTLIRRKCLEAIPFKPKELYGTEDLSWYAEAQDKGFKLMVDTGARVYHLDKNGYVYCWWQFPITEREARYELVPTKREITNYGLHNR